MRHRPDETLGNPGGSGQCGGAGHQRQERNGVLTASEQHAGNPTHIVQLGSGQLVPRTSRCVDGIGNARIPAMSQGDDGQRLAEQGHGIATQGVRPEGVESQRFGCTAKASTAPRDALPEHPVLRNPYRGIEPSGGVDG